MSTDRDTTRIVRSWLEVGATALPDRVLDAVLDQLPATPQRRSWGPARRFRDMNANVKLAIAAAAVVVVAVVGINLLPSGGVGVQRPSPTPGPTATPSPSPLPSSGSLDAGSYYFDEWGPASPRIAFAVPAGWATTEGFVHKDRGAVVPAFAPGSGPGDVVFFTWVVSHVYADACQWLGSLVDAGTTVDQLANVLVAQKGRMVSAATDVTLGGVPAKRIELTNPANLDPATCNDGFLRFWPDPGPDESGGVCCTLAGSTDVVYVLAVNGNRAVVVVRHQADSSAADVAELEAVVATIRFDASTAAQAPASPIQSPSPSPAAIPDGPLPAGSYAIQPFAGSGNMAGDMCVGQAGCTEGGPEVDSIRITFTLSDGWAGIGGTIYRAAENNSPPGGAGLLFSRGPWLYSEPCGGQPAPDIPTGSTVDDFVNALVEHPDLEVTSPVDVTLGGYSGKYLELQAPANIATSQDNPGPGECTYYFVWDPGIYAQGPNHLWHIWVLDVDEVRVVVRADTYPGTTAEVQAQLTAIVDSIKIEP